MSCKRLTQVHARTTLLRESSCPQFIMKNFFCFMAAICGLFTLVNTAWGDAFVVSDVVNNGDFVISVAVGDLNGDGTPDFVTVDRSTTFTVVTNAGNGIFVPSATNSAGISTTKNFAVAIADINGDGKPDVITMDSPNGTVSIFTNAGGGIFVSNATYTVVGETYSFLVTDINGDGKPDIIIGGYKTGTLTILTNAGGAFQLADSILVGGTNAPLAMTVAAADINGDGKPDLMVNIKLGFEVLTNAGGGIFSSNTVYSPANGGGTVTSADFNNDGKVDIAVFGGSPPSLIILTNDGNGILVQSQSFAIPNASGGRVMALDMDGDGYTDLLFQEFQFGSHITTIYNSGSGGIFITNYLNNTGVLSTVLPGTYTSAVAADINGDGKPDIVAGASTGFFILTNGLGSFPTSISINVPSNITVQATSPSGAEVDFNNTAVNWTGSWPVTNTPPSGSIFPMGTTTVTSSTGYFVKSNIFGSATTNFTVTVVDTIAPVITLQGANPLADFVHGYVDPGATATDSIYGDLTGSIVVSGNLNTNVAGTYTVTYSVTDPAGNNATTNRTVVIFPLPQLGVAATPANQTALFWGPVTNGNFLLQTTTNLAGGNWATVTNGQPLVGFYVTNSVPTAFFRLQPQ